MRRLHRLLGLVLLLPLLVWTTTGLLFHFQPGWAGAYEQLTAFDEEPLALHGLLPLGRLPAQGAHGVALGSTALGQVYVVSLPGGDARLLDAKTGAILSPLGEEGVRRIAEAAAARAGAPKRYGVVEEVTLTEEAGVVRFAGGAQVHVDRRDLSVWQRGSDTAWIDRLYELHYLRWTGSERIDPYLAPAAIGLVWLLSFTGLRLLRGGPRRRRREREARAHPKREVRRGDLYWIGPEDGGGSRPHPHVVIQDDRLNRSRVDTVVLCALTSNLRRASEPGNVLLKMGEGGLPKRSVVVVSQLVSVRRGRLGDYIGALSSERVDEIDAGLGFQQRSFFRGSGG